MTPFIHSVPNKEQTGVSEIYIDGLIASEESEFMYVVTPRSFRKQLASVHGDLTIFINSIGGDVFAAADIYTALKEFKGKVTVKVSGIAASAASVIAMAGDEVFMSPSASLMIHNVSGSFAGNQYVAADAYAMLQEADEGLVAVYAAKTGKSRDELHDMLKANTMMTAQTAVDEGFADGILYENEDAQGKSESVRAMYSLRACGANTLAALIVQSRDILPNEGTARKPAKPALTNDMSHRKEIAERATLLAALFK